MSNLVDSIIQYVDHHSIECVSFDIFDTIVFRKTAFPTDVFSTAFLSCDDAVSLPLTSEEFKELRISAEKKVKREALSAEVSLEEIYSDLPFSQKLKSSLLEQELASEKSVSYCYQPVVELIATLIQNGIKVILISDMYLSQNQIIETFFTAHPTLLDLPLYVSNEHSANKASGELFKIVLNKQHLSPERWLHLGDNYNSDFIVPKSQGIHGVWLSPQLESQSIFKTESTLFNQSQRFNSARFISATHLASEKQSVASNIGSLVWGPILFSFADWVIDNTLRLNSRYIICLMREAEVFQPAIELRLKQRGLNQIQMKRLYASRKSTFWSAVDTTRSDWLEDLMYVLVQRRGYTVDDFYRDFFIPKDDIHGQYADMKVRDADGVFHQGRNLLKLLTEYARRNIEELAAFIDQQKAQFTRYYNFHIGVPLSQCCTLDLGGGGTIQHQIEQILTEQSKANLLFYSSERIYRFSQYSYYSSFINADTDIGNLRQILARSPECIEPFLVGDRGTTIGYEDDRIGTPILADSLPQNKLPFEAFLAGVLGYFETHHTFNLGTIAAKDVLPILYRYIQFPTLAEAQLFTRVLHQDNFGSNDCYPIITNDQQTYIEQQGIEAFYLEFCRTPRTQLGKIHWPQAVMTLIHESFLRKQQGLMSMDTDNDVLELVERIKTQRWQKASVYGAGIFFEKLLPHLRKQNIQIEYVIDRKAEISGEYQVLGHKVVSLDSAIQSGMDNVIISSFAFKNEIARNIYDLSMKYESTPIEIISL